MSGGKPDRDQLKVVLMIEAAEEATRDSAGGREEFLSDRRSRSVILLDLIHLTESADKLSAGFKKAHPDVNWKRLSDLRNRGLVHDYAEANLEDVWKFVREELPRLRRRLARVSFRMKK